MERQICIIKVSSNKEDFLAFIPISATLIGEKRRNALNKCHRTVLTKQNVFTCILYPPSLFPWTHVSLPQHASNSE